MSEDEKFEEKDLGKERSRAEGDHFETRVPESEYYRLVVENQRLLVEINRVETENKDVLVDIHKFEIENELFHAESKDLCAEIDQIKRHRVDNQRLLAEVVAENERLLAEVDQVSKRLKEAESEAEKAEALMLCETEHWRHQVVGHVQMHPRGLGIRLAAQPALRKLVDGTQHCPCNNMLHAKVISVESFANMELWDK